MERGVAGATSVALRAVDVAATLLAVGGEASKVLGGSPGDGSNTGSTVGVPAQTAGGNAGAAGAGG